MIKKLLIIIVTTLLLLGTVFMMKSVESVKTGKIIIVNGTSSTGKTSLARCLQNLVGSKYLYVSMDHFLDMLSPELCNLTAGTDTFLQKNDGIYAIKKEDGTFDIGIGLVGEKILHDMQDAVEVLLQDGWNVIFTVVMRDASDLEKMRTKFAAYDPLFIYVFAQPEVLAQREKDRGDRLIGHTMNLLNAFNNQSLHDLQIDTGNVTSQEIAEKIKCLITK